ncbi:hypothetical protein L917_18218 [Phytophthora nicotianae]|uniref:Uncharacterized protein n=2 Tax=Phytophthora nicotianae TaxID=4792 RepID=W2QVX3_PHYN3|nr:hypothetical protein PPTG_05179 [Phytophthora nicotianae INRA-310]ETL81440.1 hypothetical protein L917_18218 [Phytophthora nicotianae]ETN17362.1 hypothetical protein PPTG_05179 [Phytophthora nicotianae INRA-310]
MDVDMCLPTSGRTRRRARPTSTRLPVKSSALLAVLLTLDNVNGQTLLRGLKTPLDVHNDVQRLLAGGDEEGNPHCNNSASFLGVGNTQCLHENLRTAVFLLTVIVAVSIGVDRLIHHIRAAIKCPQLRKIVNRIFEEVMILGFLSMVIFTLNTSGALKSLALNNLTASEQLHFYEFFHYIVFLTMIYFIVIVLLLLFIGTVVPKLVWEIKNHPDQSRESISDIHDDTYSSQYPSFIGSDDCGGTRRMRHSFIRDASSLARDLNPYSSGSSFMDDGDRTLDTPSDDCYIAMRGRQRSDADGVNRMGRARAPSGMDLVMGSRAYSLLLQRYQREGWWFHFNIRKQWNLWKSFEILAYNICQNRSGYIYKNPLEMERLFGVRPTRWAEQEQETEEAKNRMTYAKYHVLCMRNLLYHMTNIHPSAFLILLVICLLPSFFPNQDHWIFIGVGGLLLLVNVVIFFKVLKILRGIVDDRLRIITNRDIQARLDKVIKNSGARNKSRPSKRDQNSDADSPPVSVDDSTEEDSNPAEYGRHKKAPMKFKAAALAVRAVIRMQMSALCHRQLHHHDDRFWFNSPKLLLRLFQFATIGQAFYLVWLSLVEISSMTNSSASNGGGSALLALMVIFPALSLFVITPLTMPSLVLVMSLTGIFVDLNASNGEEEGNHRNVTQEEVKTHTRIIRRSFLRSHYSEGAGYQPPPMTPPLLPAASPALPEPIPDMRNSVASPTNVFLRVYDSPADARRSSAPYYHGNNTGNSSIGRSNSLGNNPLTRWMSHSRSVGSIGSAGGDDNGYSSRRAFNLAAFQSMSTVNTMPVANNNDENPAAQSASSFSSSTGSGCRSPRPNRMELNVPGPTMNWSQANVEPEVQLGNNAADDNNEQENDLEQIASPVSATFKSYCSKYGGYPDL